MFENVRDMSTDDILMTFDKSKKFFLSLYVAFDDFTFGFFGVFWEFSRFKGKIIKYFQEAENEIKSIVFYIFIIMIDIK